MRIGEPTAKSALRVGTWGSLLLGVLLAAPVSGQTLPAAPAEPYAAALEAAHSAQTASEIAAATRALTDLLPRYQQDVEIPLQLGWLLFRAHRFADALYCYQLAQSRSTGGGDAELGVGWSLVKLGRFAEARPHFQAVLAIDSTQRSALEGLRACEEKGSPATLAPVAAVVPPSGPPPRLWLLPQVSQTFYFYNSSPYIKYALAPMARLDAVILGRVYLGAAYRYSYFAPNTTTIAAWSQHDLYANAGYTSKSFGVTLRYALLADGSGVVGTSHHAGLSARYSRNWDILANLSASFYKDAPVLRAELGFYVPIVAGLSIRPGGAAQWTPGKGLASVSLTALYYHRWFSAWLGGKAGDESRAAYLDVSYVYIGASHIPYGAWAGAALRPGKKFSLSLGYTIDRMLRTDVTPTQDTLVHSLTLGLSREF